MSCGVMTISSPAGFFAGFLFSAKAFDSFPTVFFSQPAPSSTWPGKVSSLLPVRLKALTDWPKVASLPVWLKALTDWPKVASLPVWLKALTDWPKVASLPAWLKVASLPVWLKPVWLKVASLPVWLKVASLPVWMKVASHCGFTSWSQGRCEAWVASSDMEWKTESLVATSVEQQQAKPTEPADDPQNFPIDIERP